MRQVLGDHELVYYDPLKPTLMYVGSPEAYRKFVAFLLLKCNYGDNQHIQDHKGHYMGQDSNPTRRVIYNLWKDINKLDVSSLRGVQSAQVRAVSLPRAAPRPAWRCVTERGGEWGSEGYRRGRGGRVQRGAG